jgi:hypothetical protein
MRLLKSTVWRSANVTLSKHCMSISRMSKCLTLRLLMSYIYIYIYIYMYVCMYDVSSLRVNDLTLILLTWRKWTPNNASNWQMEFNSALKMLMSDRLFFWPFFPSHETSSSCLFCGSCKRQSSRNDITGTVTNNSAHHCLCSQSKYVFWTSRFGIYVHSNVDVRPAVNKFCT